MVSRRLQRTPATTVDGTAGATPSAATAFQIGDFGGLVTVPPDSDITAVDVYTQAGELEPFALHSRITIPATTATEGASATVPVLSADAIKFVVVTGTAGPIRLRS